MSLIFSTVTQRKVPIYPSPLLLGLIFTLILAPRNKCKAPDVPQTMGLFFPLSWTLYSLYSHELLDNLSLTIVVPQGCNSCFCGFILHSREDAFPWHLRLSGDTGSFPVLQASSPKGPFSLRATVYGWPPTCEKIPRKNPALNWPPRIGAAMR